MIKLYQGDCLEVMKGMEENSVSAIVTDPPYGLSFMGKKWDYDVPSVEIWKEALRVLKPGGTALIFAGSRTQHRMAVNVEDAGFLLKDTIMWLYGSGFPKSTDISKQLDKHGGQSVSWFGKWLREWRAENKINQKEIAKLFPSKTGGLTGCVANWELGFNMPTPEQYSKIVDAFDLPFKTIQEAEREVIGTKTTNKTVYQAIGSANTSGDVDITTPATPAAQLWNGYGTALKPAYEPIIVAMKPNDGTYANNALKHGVAGINIDGCRVGNETITQMQNKGGRKYSRKYDGSGENIKVDGIKTTTQGRFPANIIHDGSEEVLSLFPETKSGANKKGAEFNINKGGYAGGKGAIKLERDYPASSGSAARFFYTAKASKAERNKGIASHVEVDGQWQETGGNNHPTVKPIALIRYLIRLVKMPGETIILDNFMGSGMHGEAAHLEGVGYVGIEREPDNFKIAEEKINTITSQLTF